MELLIAAGVASTTLAVGYLAWRRRYRGRLLLLAAVGWGLFFAGLAIAFQVLPYGPQLFLVGCVAGAIIQRASVSPRESESAGARSGPATV